MPLSAPEITVQQIAELSS